MFKKLIIIFVIICIIGNSASAVTSPFADTDGHFAEFFSDTLWEIGILKGNGLNANINGTITRGEFSALTARAFLSNTNTSDNQIFNDIPQNHIFFKEINQLYLSGMINGRGNGRFDAESNITRGEICLILSKLESLKSNNAVTKSFSDISKSSIYYVPVQKLSKLDIIGGYPDGTFKPQNNATRGESAKMISNALKCTDYTLNTTKIQNLAKDFILNKYNDDFINTNILTGSALTDAEYVNNTRKYIKEQNASISRSISDLKLSDIENNGAIAKINLTYTASFNTSGNLNTYNTSCELKFINNKIYYFSESFKEQKPVNLTWLVANKNDSLPNNELKSVTSVSPPVFQLSAENLGVKYDDVGLNNIKLYTAISKKLNDYANSKNFKIWPIYKTDFTLKTSDTVLNNTSAQQNVIKSIIRHSISNGYDGLNIDFENIYAKNKQQLTNHIKDLTLALHELGMITSCDITRYEKTSSNWSMCYDRDAISQKCDYVMLMAYDQFYAGSPVAGPVSSIPWTEDTVKLTLNEVDSNKLVLGVPFYTRLWKTSGTKVISSKALSMQSASSQANSNNATYTYDDKYKLKKAFWQNTDGTQSQMWIEDSQSIRARLEIAKKYNLGGVASWRQGFETQDIWQVLDEYY